MFTIALYCGICPFWAAFYGYEHLFGHAIRWECNNEMMVVSAIMSLVGEKVTE